MGSISTASSSPVYVSPRKETAEPRGGGGGGLLPEKLGRGVRPASQKPYPIDDQNLRYSLPYLWPDQKFETLFMTCFSRAL